MTLRNKGIVITESQAGTNAKNFDVPSNVRFTYDGVEYIASTGRQYAFEEPELVEALLNMTEGKPTQHGLKFYKAADTHISAMDGIQGKEIPNPWESFTQRLENKGIKVEETFTGGHESFRDIDHNGSIGFFYKGKYYEAFFDKMFGSKEEVQAKLLDLIEHDDSSVRFADNQHNTVPNPILEKAPDPKNRIRFGLEDATFDNP